MKTLHRIIAVLLLFFIIAHIGNHVAAAFGIKTYNAYLSTVRIIYRHPIVEMFLIILIGLQTMTGFNLVVTSFQRAEKKSLISWLEILSAVVFVLFIVIHLTAIAVTRFYFEMQTDFYWVAEMFRAGPLQPYIMGFHFLGVVAVTTHASIGLKYMFEAMGCEGCGHILAVLFILTGLISAAIAVGAYGGVFQPIALGD